MSVIPAEWVDVVAEVIRSAMITRQSPEAIAHAALEAAEPLIRAAAVEAERERADVMKLGGMEIEAAVHRALGELQMTRTDPAVRELKDLYRAGVGAGLDIALRGATPEPEAVRVIRARVYAEVRQLATEHDATWLEPCDEDDQQRSLHTHHRRKFADLLRETP
jgi:hypothetical protein